MSGLIGAVMGRTSKETDDAFSVSSQIDANLRYAASNGIHIPDAYAFREDFFGKVLDRPELNKIRQLIRNGKIKALVIYATDRLARKVSVGEIMLDEMFEHDVQLHIIAWGTYVKNTPEDKLRFNFETTVSSFERDKIAERIQRGRKKKATQGHFVGNNRPLFGYSLNDLKTTFEPNEFAPIVREIMVSYGVHHINPARIAATLRARGVRTPGSIQYEQLMAGYKRKLDSGRLTEEQYQAKQQFAERQLGSDRWESNVAAGGHAI